MPYCKNTDLDNIASCLAIVSVSPSLSFARDTDKLFLLAQHVVHWMGFVTPVIFTFFHIQDSIGKMFWQICMKSLCIILSLFSPTVQIYAHEILTYDVSYFPGCFCLERSLHTLSKKDSVQQHIYQKKYWLGVGITKYLVASSMLVIYLISVIGLALFH